ncbi:ankyrin repeat domain-containing protein, partial [Campylobacter blaseri]
KDTNKVLNFLKEHNLSVDTKFLHRLTPLMYSSFYNDLNTSKELIKLGANIRAKDRYKLSPLAYAVENNSTLTAKLLLDSGVKFDELTQIQYYLKPPFYRSMKNIIVDGDDITIIYKGKWNTDEHSKDETEPFEYIVVCNFVELARIVLESGYVPKRLEYPETIQGISEGHSRNLDIEFSVFSRLDDIPNHEQMLDLLLKYNVYGGELTKEQLKMAYDRCYKWYYDKCFIDDNMKCDVYKFYEEEFALEYNHKMFRAYCSTKNSTFKDIKEFFRYANEDVKYTNISSFFSASPKSVYIKDKNMTLEELRIHQYKNTKDEKTKKHIETYFLKNYKNINKSTNKE